MLEFTADFNYEVELAGFNKSLMRYLDEIYDEDLHLTQLKEMMKYSLECGGKRLRPLLLIEFCKAYGGSYSTALPYAIAIEMIHTYSLIHDDLPSMDNDDLRRGMPTCHKKFGEANAILTGDALLSLAHEIMIAGCVPHYEGQFTANAIKASLYITKAAGMSGMINGQIMDLANERSEKTVDKATLDYINTNKTGALFSAAAIAGALLAKHDTTDIYRIKEAMNKIGLAFQIIDDILDIVGDEKVIGKSIGKDNKSQKMTYPQLLGIDEARNLAEKLQLEAKNELSSLGVSMTSIFKLLDMMVSRKY